MIVESLPARRQRLGALVGAIGTPRPPTVAGVVRAYLEHVEQTYPERRGRSSTYTNARDATRAVLDLWPDLPPMEYGAREQAMVRALLMENGYSRRTVNDRLSRIRSMWRWAVSIGWLDPAQMVAVESVRSVRPGYLEREPRRAVSPELYRATLPHVYPAARAILELLFYTGARPQEICGMRGSEVQTGDTAREAGYVWANDAGTRTGTTARAPGCNRPGPTVWTFTPRAHKNAHRRHRRTIYFGPRAQSVLRPWLTDGYCFLTRCGRPWGSPALYTAVRRACDAQGLPRWSPSMLRHLRKDLTEERYGIEAASVILGHARVETTQLYGSRDDALALRVAGEAG